MRAFVPRRLVLPAALASIVLFDISCGNDSGSPSPTPTDLIVTPGADTLISVGETRTFTAQVLDANGHPIDAATVTWSSSAPAVLSVEPTTGVATAVANGSAQVTATSGTLQGAANVIVAQIVASVTVTPANVGFTAVGDTARFTAVAKDAGGTPVVGAQILWSVSDNTVATIDTLGLAKAKGPGTALVSAQAQTRAGYAALGVDPTVTQFVVLGGPDTGTAGEVLTTALQVELRDARGNRVIDASLPVTISAAGDATGTPLHGTTTIITDAGRATFTGLWLERAGNDRLKVTVGLLPADSSTLLAVAADVPARVSIDSVAYAYTAGVPLDLTAHIRDRFGNPTTTYSGPVIVRRIAGPGFGDLFGDTLVSAAAGDAQFTTLNIHRAADFYRLVVSIPDLPSSRDTSALFSVLSAAPATFGVAYFTPIRVSLVRAQDSNVVAVSDSFGNPVSNSNLTVSVRPLGWAYAAPPGRALKLLGDTAVTVTGGEARFYTAADRPGRISLEFSVPGLGADTTEQFLTPFPDVNIGLYGSMAQSSCLTPSLCVGDNAYGQLGVPTVEIPSDSVPITRDSAFTGYVFSMDAGARHACAIVEESGLGARVDCWGDNSDGQLGGGTVGGTSHFQVVSAVYPAIDLVSAGGSHTCMSANGAATCWGRNDLGQLGNGAAGASTGTPVAVTGNHNFAVLAAGGRHTCGIDGSGTVWCWGANDFGQLGNGDTTGTPSADPVQVSSGLIFSGLAAGDDFTCATHYEPGNYAVYCWGRNDARQLGPATDSARSAVPVLVMTGSVGFIPGTLTAGARFACVGLDPGQPTSTIQCWGANEHGQLGRGTFTPSESLPAAAYTGFLAQAPGSLSAGAEFVCGATSEFPSRYLCWGRNDHGQFGVGSTGDQSTPLLVEGSF